MVDILKGPGGAYKDGVTFHKRNRFELKAYEHTNVNDYSVSAQVVSKVASKVCQNCSSFDKCKPEFEIAKKFLSPDELIVRGAEVSSENCILRDSTIPDNEFRKKQD